MNSVQRKLAKIPVLAFFPLLLVLPGVDAQAAGTVKAGHEKARMCEACHGLDGRSKVPEAPNLAGQIEGYMVAQLKAFKKGERKNEQMSVIVQALSLKEIDDLAAYYSAIEVTVGKIPGE